MKFEMTHDLNPPLSVDMRVEEWEELGGSNGG